VSANKVLTRMARRFVAGETAEEALKVVASLNERGVLASLDLLGENVSSADDAKRCAAEYCSLIAAIASAGLQANVSLKLTMLGLDSSEELCRDNLTAILDIARSKGNMFVRIDMEGSAYTQKTLDVFLALRREYDNLGIVLQAMLKRTQEDLRRILDAGGRVRLCKGAYKEPPALAFQKMYEIQANFLECVNLLFERCELPAIATHDQRLIDETLKLAARRDRAKDSFEFQMLYGLRRDTWYSLSAEGYRFRVYVPFGTHWLPYFTRRLRERKENVLFVLSNLFSR